MSRRRGERDEGKERTNLLLESIVSIHVIGSDRVESGLLEHSDVAGEGNRKKKKISEKPRERVERGRTHR